jgi:hypothetical protein
MMAATHRERLTTRNPNGLRDATVALCCELVAMWLLQNSVSDDWLPNINDL